VSTPELWSAAAEVVEIWVDSPHVVAVRDELWKDLDSDEAIKPLRILAMREPQDIRSMPLAVYKAFPHMGIELTARDRQFMAHSLAVEKAVVWLMWSARSKLPGFPSIAAPQLAEHSRLTMNNSTPPWTRQAMQAGFQYQNLAVQVNTSLGVDCRASVNRLLSAFGTLPSWADFQRAQEDLDADLRSELLAARRSITERAINDDSTTDIESDDPWMRLKRARTIADKVITELSSRAQTYALAFERVNDEIDLVIANVITSLVAWGPPEILSGVGGLIMLATQPLTVTFQLTGAGFAQTSRVYWTDDSLVTDAMYVDGFYFGGDQIHGDRIAFDATVLVGTQAAWR
jgi:hypothetical protein